jgi:hypothetical protein
MTMAITITAAEILAWDADMVHVGARSTGAAALASCKERAMAAHGALQAALAADRAAADAWDRADAAGDREAAALAIEVCEARAAELVAARDRARAADDEMAARIREG